MRWFLEITVGILLFPVFIILGLFCGIIDCYRAYNDAVEKSMGGND